MCYCFSVFWAICHWCIYIRFDNSNYATILLLNGWNWDTRGYHRFWDDLDETDTDQQTTRLYHTTDADQAGFTHLVIVDCSLENNIQLCSKSQLDMSRYRRGCDLRGEKAIRAKAGMWPYKKELFQALISWSAKCSENSGFAAVIIILLILQFIWSVDSCFVAAFKTGADALASKIQH